MLGFFNSRNIETISSGLPDIRLFVYHNCMTRRDFTTQLGEQKKYRVYFFFVISFEVTTYAIVCRSSLSFLEFTLECIQTDTGTSFFSANGAVLIEMQYAGAVGEADISVSLQGELNLVSATQHIVKACSEELELDETSTQCFPTRTQFPDLNCTFRDAAFHQEILNDLDELRQGDPVVGELNRTLSSRDCGGGSCEMGSLYTDALVSEFSEYCDVAFLNNGGLRETLQGNFTQQDIRSTSPFPNTVSAFKIRGDYLLDAFQLSFSSQTRLFQGSGNSVFQVSRNFRVTLDPSKPRTIRVVGLDVFKQNKFEPVSVTDTYFVCTNNFLRKGGSGFTMLENNVETTLESTRLVSDSAETYLASLSDINEYEYGERFLLASTSSVRPFVGACSYSEISLALTASLRDHCNDGWRRSSDISWTLGESDEELQRTFVINFEGGLSE